VSFNRQECPADNIEAVRLALELEKSGMQPTSRQREILGRYCRFGGLKCILLPKLQRLKSELDALDRKIRLSLELISEEQKS
jgi:hypothetical protein